MSKVWYVADVSTGKSQSVRCLEIKLMAYDDRSETFVRAMLFGHEDITQVKFYPPLDSFPSTSEMVLEVAKDLIHRMGVEGRLNWLDNPNSQDVDKRLQLFEEHWKMKTFGNALRAYGVKERLTLEQARCVLEEHYVIEPIMEA